MLKELPYPFEVYCFGEGEDIDLIGNEQIEMRRLAAERYRSHLEGVEGLQLNYVNEATESNYAYFPVIFHEKIFGSSRNEVSEELLKHGICARKYFYPLTNTFECYHDRYDVSQTPNALYVSRRVLALPMYPELPFEDIDRICKVILNCRRKITGNVRK